MSPILTMGRGAALVAVVFWGRIAFGLTPRSEVEPSNDESALYLSDDVREIGTEYFVTDFADDSAAENQGGTAGESPDNAAANHKPAPDADKSKSDSSASKGAKSGSDQELIRTGQGYFESSCTQCHDAARATSKRKSSSAWLATIRRMAAKDGADIPASQHAAIAAYLASLGSEGGGTSGGEGGGSKSSGSGAAAADEGEQSLTFNATLSPVYRGAQPGLENKGFFPDTWIGVDWRPAKSPVSGRVMACASCHGVINNGLGVELVEASATVDLCHLLCGCPREKRDDVWQAEMKAGRFIVPFGAYSERVHPGSLQTVSLPLMFNMGRRVGNIGILQPVLPLPYADEGVDLHSEHKIGCQSSATLDVYGVNGLQSGGPGEFTDSRSYVDNNSNTSVGYRATIGDQTFRLGGSMASGELQAQGGPVQNYDLTGGDASLRIKDWLRVYYEYAIRVEDSFGFVSSRSIAYGNYVEADVKLLDDPTIWFVERYDTLNHRGFLGTQDTDRITTGLNWVLPGGSLLIVDHEYWQFNDGGHANVLGMRWTVTF
jgi:hypothetical protein